MVCFTYEDEHSGEVEDALRRPRWTRSRLTQTGWQHYGPPGQKFDDIWSQREERAHRVAAWFSKYVPGVFTSGGFDAKLPTCELLTFREAMPFPLPEEPDPATRECLQMLGVFFRSGLVWSVADKPGVKLRLPHGIPGERPAHHLVLTSKESDWRAGPALDNETVSRILAGIGTTYLVQGFGDMTREVRYSVASSPVAGRSCPNRS